MAGPNKNTILLSSDAMGRREWGIINDTSKPGTFMQIDSSVTPVNGRFGWKAAAVGTDGKAILKAILLEDYLQGFTPTTAYVAGTQGQIYFPQEGDEVNARCSEVAGTGNTYAVGDRLMIDAEDGILVPESGSPVETLAVVLEVITQQTGSGLVAVKII